MTEQEVKRALGGEVTEVFRGAVLAALPTVAAFERDLEAMGTEQQAELLESAARIADHKFDLLGSGPTYLGERIDWTRDFKSGHKWPLEHISRLPIVLGGGADIKVPWELSRFQHLPLLAAAYRLTANRHWLDEIGAQLDDWISSNPVEFGPNWACTMDVAIRAANWIATMTMVAEAGAGATWFMRALETLLLHGRFIRTHLEWGPVRGNHYLSDLVGLLTVAAVFERSSEGRSWLDFAADSLLDELLQHQVRADGCDHEASIPYHRLVTELFIAGVQVCEAFGADLPTTAAAKIEQMLGFVSDYVRPDGLAPQVGDADDGRYLPLADYGNDPRDHTHLFAQAGLRRRIPTTHAAYPHGGYWMMRAEGLYVLVRCGDVGLGGIGGHAHNDALSFEFAADRQPLVIDPGSYLYTAAPLERNRFRGTSFHSTLQVDAAEQNELRSDSLFDMADRRRAEAITWDPAPHRPVFVGRHFGFASLAAPAVHTRELCLDVARATLQITDSVASSGAHDLGWSFPLAPCVAKADRFSVTASFHSGLRLEIRATDVELTVEQGWFSPSYGRRERVPFIRGRKRIAGGPTPDLTVFELQVRR